MDQNQLKFIEKIKATLTKYSMLAQGELVLVGLSGGPDSVCLLHVLHRVADELRLKLHALYIDHGLRPEETPGEIEFCQNMCDSLSVPFATRSIDVKTYGREHGLNRQEAARELRYRVFDEVFHEVKADKIALGHTADDQIETFFMRLLRGAGPRGLSGIPPVRAKVIRPLIEKERREIMEFLDGQDIESITDSSNLKEDYLRNRIRISFIPEMKKINPHIAQTLAGMTDILREEEKYFDVIVTKALMKLISRKTDSRIELFLIPLETMETVILRRVLRRAMDETSGLRGIAFRHTEDIIDLIKRGRHGDRINLPKGIRVIKDYALLVITSDKPQRIRACTLHVPGEVLLSEGKAVIRASVESAVDTCGNGRTEVVLDADKTGEILTVRSRKRGDLLFPLGFGRKKKLQDLLVDEKVPRDERDNVPIVVSGDDIVWVAGYRGDERFGVTDETRRFLRLEFRQTV